MKGRFVVVDGLDGVGKGEFIKTFVEEAKKDGKRIFDLHEFWVEHDFHPPVQDIIGKYDVVLSSEPTFIGVGRVIRRELIAKHNRGYSAEAVAQAYALDRHILAQNVILPLLEAGIDIYQSRSFASSIVYQKQSSIEQGGVLPISEILQIPGNAFCYHHCLMNYLIIPTIADVSEVIERLRRRTKDDNCRFEDLPFQLKIKYLYESEEFKQFFSVKGVTVIYMDASKSLDYSRQQAREFYNAYLK